MKKVILSCVSILLAYCFLSNLSNISRYINNTDRYDDLVLDKYHKLYDQGVKEVTNIGRVLYLNYQYDNVEIKKIHFLSVHEFIFLVGVSTIEEPITNQTITEYINEHKDFFYDQKEALPFIEESNLYLSSKDCKKINQAISDYCGLILIKYEVRKNGRLYTCYTLDKWTDHKFEVKNGAFIPKETKILLPDIFLENIK